MIVIANEKYVLLSIFKLKLLHFVAIIYKYFIIHLCNLCIIIFKMLSIKLAHRIDLTES